MIHYKEEDGMYYMVDEDGSILWAGERVAVGFSYEPEDEFISGTLHKHGSPEEVLSWANTLRAKITKGMKTNPETHPQDEIFTQMRNAITVVSGKIPPEELNKMISTTGYVGKWYKELQGGEQWKTQPQK